MAGGPGGYNNMQGGYGGVAAQASGSGTYGYKTIFFKLIVTLMI